jgi:hypothetical protein
MTTPRQTSPITANAISQDNPSAGPVGGTGRYRGTSTASIQQFEAPGGTVGNTTTSDALPRRDLATRECSLNCTPVERDTPPNASL